MSLKSRSKVAQKSLKILVIVVIVVILVLWNQKWPDSLTEWVTRSPIELSWTAKNNLLYVKDCKETDSEFLYCKAKLEYWPFFIRSKAFSVLGKVSGKLNLPRPIKGPVWQRNVCAGRENPGYPIVKNKSYCQSLKIYDDKKINFR